MDRGGRCAALRGVAAPGAGRWPQGAPQSALRLNIKSGVEQCTVSICSSFIRVFFVGPDVYCAGLPRLLQRRLGGETSADDVGCRVS